MQYTRSQSVAQIFFRGLPRIFVLLPANYTYLDSPHYISNLIFDYVETYSFQRGKEYDENVRSLQAEFFRLKEHLSILTADEQKRLEELQHLVGVTQYLVDDRGRFHPSAKKTNSFPHDHPAVERIKQILLTDVVDIPLWMCSPFYRDALVFYNRDGHIVSVLNVCLSCRYMETKMFAHIHGDSKTYDLLKKFFVDMGHEVEER